MTPTAPVAIVSLLQWARAEHAALSPLALSQRQHAPIQAPLPTQPRWRSAMPGSGKAASQRADAALSTTGGGMWIDSSRRFGQGGPLRRHLRPSRDHIAGDLEEPGTASAPLSGVGPRLDGRGETAGGRSSEPERAVVLRHFSHWPRRILPVGDGRLRGEGGAHRGLRYDGGPPRKVEKTKGRRGSLEKAAGDARVFIPSRMPGLQIGRLRHHPRPDGR